MCVCVCVCVCVRARALGNAHNVQFSSVQFKTVSMHSEEPIMFSSVQFKTISMRSEMPIIIRSTPSLTRAHNIVFETLKQIQRFV